MSDWDAEVLKNQIFDLETENEHLRAEILALHQELETYHRDTGHIVDLREDGWTIQHPLSCRPNLFDCIYNFAAARVLQIGGIPGRYQVTVDAGELIIGERL